MLAGTEEGDGKTTRQRAVCGGFDFNPDALQDLNGYFICLFRVAFYGISANSATQRRAFPNPSVLMSRVGGAKCRKCFVDIVRVAQECSRESMRRYEGDGGAI